jgi:hypothetical protein
MLALILACTDAKLAYRTGIAADTPWLDSLKACGKAGENADECTATAVRNHPTEATASACIPIASARWQAECRFSLAEALAKKGDRWGALSACGQAGRYYDECLYHAWTFELQAHAENLQQAWRGVEGVRESIAWWSGIETVSPDPTELLWQDWWYFAHTRNKPARLSGCSQLINPDDLRRCMDGTRNYVFRSVAEGVARSPQKDRVCRGGPQEALRLFPDAWEADPLLDAALQEGLTLGCEGLKQRPWNPIFGPRRHGPG